MFSPEYRIAMSAEEYLAFEETAAVRHEFVDGEVFAMSGVTLRHNLIVDNMHSLFKAHLDGSNCRSFTTGVKVRIEASNSFYYPDIMVSCTPTNTTAFYLESPVLIVEVLSPSTAAIDRREKRTAYKKLESLQEYIIVHQSQRRIDIFRKMANGQFAEAAQYIGEGVFIISSFPTGPLRIDLAQVYENIDWGESSHGEDYGDDPNSDCTVREMVGELTW